MDGFAGLSSAVRGKPCSGSVKLAYFLYLNQIKRTARRRSFIFSLKSYREYPDWLYCQKIRDVLLPICLRFMSKNYCHSNVGLYFDENQSINRASKVVGQ